MSAEQTALAEQKVRRFVESFGEPHRLLACYAALPLILTPELLNYLRNHFLRGEVPWVAEADLLLSELCRPVAHEQFAMAPEVRAYLLGMMRAERGETQMQETARLLIRHVRQLSRMGSPFSREELQAEQWSAMAYLTDGRTEAARQIAQSFRDSLIGEVSAGLDPRTYVPVADLVRLVRITAQLEPQLREYRELLDYAAEVGRLIGRPDGLARLAEVRRSRQPSITAGKLGVALPSLRPAGQGGAGPRESPPAEPVHRPTPFRDSFRDGSGAGPQMVWLPGGTFRMGDSQGLGQERERPVHNVTLSHFAVGTYPLTVGEFRRFVEATGYKTEAEHEGGADVWNRGNPEWKKDANWRKPYMEQDDRHPVVCISWNDANAYCKWLSRETGQTYGLLTEAQWECACRAGSDTAYCFGNDEQGLEAYAWFGDSSRSGSTHPVGEKRPNAWGLHDMHGNVWEWCADWFSEDYYAQLAGPAETSTSELAAGASRDPSGPESGSDRVVRGGSWFGGADYCRSACRDWRGPSARIDDLGFRLSRIGPLHSYPFTLGPPEAEVRPEVIPGLRDPLRSGGEGPTMVWLPGGVFTMGQDDSPYDDEKPAHPVRVDAFSIG
jgi:formylglycine-generating enzyme required for sulfatase activity